MWVAGPGGRSSIVQFRLPHSAFVILSSLLIGWLVNLTNVNFGIIAVGGAGMGLSILAIATPKLVRSLL